MKNTNEMSLEFDAVMCNVSFACIAVATFVTQINPSLEEISDIKTAVSEAVENSIIHGYEYAIKKIRIECFIRGKELSVKIIDWGRGIKDIKMALEPMYTTKPEKDRAGMGFSFMEAFMDELKVESEPGVGCVVLMKKYILNETSTPCNNETKEVNV